MNDQLNESISALMDGQADDLEVRRVLKLLDDAQSPAEAEEIMAQWERYQRIGASLRGDRVDVLAAPGFAASVSAAVRAETQEAVSHEHESVTTETGLQTETPVPFWRRFAVAATVAFAVIIGVQEFGGVGGGINGVDGNGNLLVDSQPAISETPAVASGFDQDAAQLASATQTNELSSDELSDLATRLETAEAQKRLNEYLLQHTSHAAQQSGQGMMPFARLANFDEE